MKNSSANSSANDKNVDLLSDAAESGIAREFHNFVADVEDLFKATANLSGEELNLAKAKLNQRITEAKQSIEGMSETLVKRARKTAETTNAYVHDKPWNAVGVSAAAGLLVGYLLTRKS
jgi:ElaB/YqjD/DUF883 family membrane-anchored ribosome-binding protein